MRGLILAAVVSVGLGLTATTNSWATSAAPVNAGFSRATEQTNLVQRAWYNRYGQWCSRRCNWRRCWVICR